MLHMTSNVTSPECNRATATLSLHYCPSVMGLCGRCVNPEVYTYLRGTAQIAQDSDDDISGEVPAHAKLSYCFRSHSEWLGRVSNSRCTAEHQPMWC